MPLNETLVPMLPVVTIIESEFSNNTAEGLPYLSENNLTLETEKR